MMADGIALLASMLRKPRVTCFSDTQPSEVKTRVIPDEGKLWSVDEPTHVIVAGELVGVGVGGVLGDSAAALLLNVGPSLGLTATRRSLPPAEPRRQPPVPADKHSEPHRPHTGGVGMSAGKGCGHPWGTGGLHGS